MPRWSRIFQVLFLFAGAPSMARAADSCVALIPPRGAFQVVDSHGNQVQFNDAKSMYCSDTFASYANSHGINAAFQYFAVGGSGSENDQQTGESREQFCGNSQENLTTVDQAALYRMQGDDVIASAFVQCEKLNHQAPGPWALSAQSTSSNVTLTIQPNFPPSAHEVVLGVSAVGASAQPGISIAPNSQMTVNNALIGNYVLAQPSATFIVHTTAGDKTVTINKCLDGLPAGPWSAQWTTTVMQPQTFPVSWTQGVPQAGCHPHCHTEGDGPDIGDPHTYTFQAPAGAVSVGSPQYQCQGNGCAFEDQVSFSQPDPTTIVFHIRSRSEPVNVVISATATRMVPTPQNGGQSGTATYATAFNVLVPSGAQNAALTINGTTVPLSGLAHGQFSGSSIFVTDPGTSVGSGTSYGFRFDGPECTATAQ
jgi:hypothetical protein